MGRGLLAAALTVAYLPFILMALAYLVALVLRAAGRPGTLQWLTRRTAIPSPVERAEQDAW